MTILELVEGKRIALVGPAKYMQGSKLRKEIDAHETVARINRGIESIEDFSEDIGTRTDLYFSCLIERAQQTGKLNAQELRARYGIKLVVAPPISDMKGLNSTPHFHSLVNMKTVREIAALMPIGIMTPEFHTALALQVDCKPNTGFAAIYYLLSLKPKSLSIYGFSFYLDGFIEGQKSGVENEKNCTEQGFADMAFASKRHVQVNMWNHAKKTLLNNPIVKLDKMLEAILSMEEFSREKFRELDL